jgi:hypothetical protein
VKREEEKEERSLDHVLGLAVDHLCDGDPSRCVAWLEDQKKRPGGYEGNLLSLCRSCSYGRKRHK